MAEPSEWILLYAYEAERPERVCEIRRHEAAVFVEHGRAGAPGDARFLDFADRPDAAAFVETEIARAEAGGLAVAHRAPAPPGGFDDALFEQVLARGLAAGWRDLAARYGADAIRAFTLSTDSDPMAIGFGAAIGPKLGAAALTSEDAFWTYCDPDQEGDRRYIETAYRMILARHRVRDWADVHTPPNFRARIFLGAVAALDRLRKDGLTPDDCVALFLVHDGDQVAGMFERLNPTLDPALFWRAVGEDSFADFAR